MTLTTTPVSRPGLYGPNGWTRQLKLTQLLLSTPKQTAVSFARFDQLTADVAAHLRKQLPPAALTDRQNNAPTLDSLLQACINHPDEVELSGYIIGPNRYDERLTVDMISIHSPWQQAHSSPPETSATIRPLPDFWSTLPNQCAPKELWRQTSNYLGLDALAIPDEIEYFTPLNGSWGGWWMWWD